MTDRVLREKKAFGQSNEALIEKEEGVFDGRTQKHHEIYLSGFRKVAPEKMITVLRKPFIKNDQL